MPERDEFLVTTEHGPVVVAVNPECQNALEADLLMLSAPSREELLRFSMETPLRAFGSKMVDIIESVGTGDFDPGPTMREMLIKEKASSEMARIERWAREHATD